MPTNSEFDQQLDALVKRTEAAMITAERNAAWTRVQGRQIERQIEGRRNGGPHPAPGR